MSLSCQPYSIVNFCACVCVWQITRLLSKYNSLRGVSVCRKAVNTHSSFVLGKNEQRKMCPSVCVYNAPNEQCDQMVTFFQDLAICNNENQPNNVTYLPKYAQHFAKLEINGQKLGKYLLTIAKVANFRQIWSHWLEPY